ncbi:Eco57I restriction-modification methylase domain-containing protein [Entomospira entomophila]|uniref:site-specific DNA-methyltransferase (adenine-specific) n=1 Tax=Entomospira entomophila TaxID=2719988 RepID=A0A968G993_9SPIO|nr:Eco57I restriction-modification methylase domain-containing protein [Entomospira entomophilus]NIZ40925.1 N-6 DNA methylase [Entomospira entomophilus]WDI35138.1 Eco57I restriction-modification methylase domain-containing protein [Entomospira entomophilus]
MLDIESLELFLGRNRVISTVEDYELQRFKKRLQQFFTNIELVRVSKGKESAIEEAIRGLMSGVFSRSNSKLDFAKEDNYDIVVRKSDGNIATLVECKKVSANEMSTFEKLNSKALQQLIYYYLKIVVKNEKTKPTFEPNLTMKNLMISDGYTWFVWEKQNFYDLIKEKFTYNGSKTTLAKVYSQITRSKETYPIIEQYIEQLGEDKFRQKCAYLDLSQLTGVEDLSEKELSLLYHFFSASVWLGQSSYLDPNSLNKEFYHELLHVMGLQEVDMKGSTDGMKIIVPNPDAEYSLYDQVRRNWEDSVPASTTMHEGILENIIPWVNRVLFLKLLEAHIITARDKDELSNEEKRSSPFAFMTHGEAIKEWSDLQTLFFKVLAIEHDKREEVPIYFKHIPYLNSSLFTYNASVEQVKISELATGKKMRIHRKSVLKGMEKEELPLIEYLLKFLSAYDFSTDGKSTIRGIEANMINASVLGKVFEKLNGYKDGSFYTPSFITTYICKESIQQSLIGRVNETLELEQPFQYYHELKEAFDDWHDRRSKNVEVVQKIIRSLTVLDPAVGSGHFLVSALNELMQVRYDFAMLQKMGATLEIVNDELLIRDPQSCDVLRYSVYRAKTQTFQQELFHAKQEIIENNLFGVDINSKSVEICRLRLWIELLKNSYYHLDEKRPTDTLETLKTTYDYVGMATLPNIDINIKTGNSLIYQLPLNDQKDDLMWNTLLDHLKEYNQAVQAYKHVRQRAERKELEATIRELSEHTIPSDLMFKGQASELGTEWRYLFPESLDKESGAFIGFDVVVGNPPYIQLQSMQEAIKKRYETMQYQTFTKTGDIYMLFYELGIQLLRGKPWGQMGMVTSNKWMMANYGEKLRTYLMETVKINTLIDFNDSQFFDNATTYPNILMVSYSARIDSVYYSFDQRWIPSLADKDNNLYELLKNYEPKTLLAKADRFILKQKAELDILQKVQTLGKPLGKWDVTINRGILTGLNEAFYLTTEQKDALIIQDPKSAEMIVPMLRGREIMPYHQHVQHNEWLIATFPALNINIDDYPAVKQHLMQWYDRLQQTGEKGTRKKSSNKWFETQDSIAYWQDFAKPKISWTRLSKYVAFNYDEKGYYTNDSSCIIVHNSNNMILKYLTGILNSHLYFYLWDFYLPKLMGNTFQVRQVFLVQVPILVPMPEQEAHVVALVDAIIQAKQTGKPSIALEQELDAYIFTLYGLTDEEIAIIKSVPKPIKEG